MLVALVSSEAEEDGSFVLVVATRSNPDSASHLVVKYAGAVEEAENALLVEPNVRLEEAEAEVCIAGDRTGLADMGRHYARPELKVWPACTYLAASAAALFAAAADSGGLHWSLLRYELLGEDSPGLMLG